MTIEEVTALLQQNNAMYAGRVPTITVELATVQIGIWSATLADVPAKAAQAALMRAFTVCRYPVTLADLCAQLHAMQAEADPPAGLLWDKITTAAHRARENKGLYSYTGRAADGRTIADAAREANREIFESLPAPARAWVGELQTLIDLDGEDQTGKGFRRRDFEKFYQEYQATQPLDPEKLAALPCVAFNPSLDTANRPQVEA